MPRSRRPGIFERSSIGDFPPLHMNPQEFSDLVILHGSSGELRPGVLCPCMRVETKRPSAGCDVCRGTGWIYPKDRRCPMVFLDHSRSVRRQHNGPGYLSDGTIAVTFPCGVVPAKGDLLLPDGEIHVVHEIFHRDVNQVNNRLLEESHRKVRDDALQRSRVPDWVRRPFQPTRNRLLYPEHHEIEALYWIRDDDLVEARRGIEYRLDPDGTITWIHDGPARGQGFTVRYRAPAAYIIHPEAPSFRHESDLAMPWSARGQALDRLQPDGDLW